MVLARHIAVGALLLAPVAARAERQTTREALERMEEVLAMRAEDASVDVKELGPVIVVSTAAMYEESRAWYPAAALGALARAFGPGALRACEACMSPRTLVEGGVLEQNSGPISVDEILRLDESARGRGPPARTAAWLDESESGVSLRMVDLRTSRIVLADNFDPRLKERARTERVFTLARELDRRTRGESITQLFVDAALYPGQHVSFDWTEQWGDTNANLTGVTVSFFDPVLGLGGCYYRVIPEAFNVMLGAQLLLSLPSAALAAVTSTSAGFPGDNLVTLAGVIRFPIGRSNYGIVGIVSTNGRVGVGISLLNISLLPVLP